MRCFPFFFVSLVATGCSGSEQVVTGRIAPGFPSQVTSVRAVQSGRVLATAPVATDGSFRLAFQPGAHVAFQLVGGGKTKLVFPRQTGGLLTTVSVRPNGTAFDLGTVRFVGEATATTFAFKSGPEAETECEDGHDSTGNMCVDDDDDDHGTCEAEDDEGDHEQEHDAGDADDEGEASDDVDDGLSDDGDAVAEHNFPADGCSDDDENEAEDD
jgi:hypothetical protein